MNSSSQKWGFTVCKYFYAGRKNFYFILSQVVLTHLQKIDCLATLQIHFYVFGMGILFLDKSFPWKLTRSLLILFITKSEAPVFVCSGKKRTILWWNGGMTTKHVPKNSPSFIRTLVDEHFTKRSIVRDAFWKSSNPKMLVGRSPKYAGWHSTVTRLPPHKIEMCRNSQYAVKYLDGGLKFRTLVFLQQIRHVFVFVYGNLNIEGIISFLKSIDICTLFDGAKFLLHL